MCTGIAQRRGGDGVGFSMVRRWFNKVWLEQGVHEQGVVRNVLAEQVLLLIGRTSDPYTPG